MDIMYRNKNLTLEERRDNAEKVMWKFARMFDIGEVDKDPYDTSDALKELEKEAELKGTFK